MVIIKNYYYLYIENLADINFDNFKINKKINIIYRNPKNSEINEIIKFKKKCMKKKFKFFIANNEKIALKTKANGLYISAFNKNIYHLNIKKIGAAHNLKEINQKIKQNCKTIIVSRLFKTNYINKTSFLGVTKFNLIRKIFNKDIIPLGGINSKNILSLNLINCNGFALLSEIKKKPAIASRLF